MIPAAGWHQLSLLAQILVLGMTGVVRLRPSPLLVLPEGRRASRPLCVSQRVCVERGGSVPPTGTGEVESQVCGHTGLFHTGLLAAAGASLTDSNVLERGMDS